MTASRFPIVPAVVAAILIATALCSPDPAFAQGNIFGTVQNADATHPAASELLWIGFLDDTDEEIRIELSAGAGYDGVHWYDDFQNYTTEAAGNPYDFFYLNIANGQAFHLAGAIPSNSYEQQDVVLAPATPPARPTDLNATVMSPATIELTWNGQPGLTYHIYRRVALNNGVFRRIDDPTGDLANHGVPGSSYTDNTSDGTSSYAYIIMAEDDQGHYSAHSEEVTINASGLPCDCDCHADPMCDGVTDVLDVVLVVNVAIRGAAPLPDPNSACPYETTDVDCSGFTDVIDAVLMIDVASRGGDPAVRFCSPCAP